MNASNEFFNSEDVLETYRPNKLRGFFNLLVLIVFFVFCTTVMFSDPGGELIVPGIFLHLMFTLPWAFFACKDPFFRKRMWMKVTKKGIAISSAFGKLVFIPWDKIRNFEDRTMVILFTSIPIDPRVFVNFVEDYETIEGVDRYTWDPSLQLSYFYNAKKTTERLNDYLSKFK